MTGPPEACLLDKGVASKFRIFVSEVTIDAMSFNTFERLERLGLFYVRYMDDIVVLAPTGWTLRGAVKVLNQTFAALRLEKHPGKTYIGRIERGFDFLGYHLQPEAVDGRHRYLRTVCCSCHPSFTSESRGRFPTAPGLGCT